MNIKEQMTKLQDDSHGREITLKEANEMIHEFRDLDEIVNKAVKPSEPEGPRKKRALELIARKYNAFIFHRSLIERFFAGPKQSEYLMVLLGAHSKDETYDNRPYKGGSFTVITVGADLTTVIQDEREITAYVATNTEKPGNEYPPRLILAQLGVMKGMEGDKEVLYFKVID